LTNFIKGVDRNQIMLLPNSVDQYISPDNEVRVIDAFVNNLDLDNLGFNKYYFNRVGAPSYDPKDLLKILIYCYPKKIRASRKMAIELNRNLELIWLVRGINPDFRTISDFRKDNIKSIEKILKHFNKLCLELNVFSRELSSLDGSKFKAVNSKDNNFTKDKLADRIKRLDKKVNEYLKQLDNADKFHSLPTEDKIDISDKLLKAQKKALEYNNLLTQLVDSNENQISLTDKDSRLMKCNNNMLVGFNASMSVDTKSHIITSLDVSNKPNDFGCMFDMGQMVKDAYNEKQIEQLADGGYVDQDDIKKCLENKIVPILPEGEYAVTWDYKDNDINEQTKKGETSEDVKKCLESGVIPECYSYLDMDINIETFNVVTNPNAIINEFDEDILKAKANEGFFVRNKDKNILYCPMNNILKFKRKKNKVDIFIGNSKCINCEKKCTKSLVKELEIPFNVDIKSSNAFHKQVKKGPNIICSKKIVVLKYRPDKKKYKLRKNTSEHPFGTLKRSHDASYFLLKGLDKVKGELTLSVLGYNIKRLINIVGVEKLINHLNNRPISTNFSYFLKFFYKFIKKMEKVQKCTLLFN